MDASMIGEEINENEYEPSEEELIEYAQYLGMDPLVDKKYLYIAKEGLNAPLPREWKACKNEQDEIFYKHIKTNETTWSHPLDDFFRQKFIDAKKKDKENELIERQKPKPGKQLPKIMINAGSVKNSQNKALLMQKLQNSETKSQIQDNLNKNISMNYEIDKKCSNIQQEKIKNNDSFVVSKSLFDNQSKELLNQTEIQLNKSNIQQKVQQKSKVKCPKMRKSETLTEIDIDFIYTQKLQQFYQDLKTQQNCQKLNLTEKRQIYQSDLNQKLVKQNQNYFVLMYGNLLKKFYQQRQNNINQEESFNFKVDLSNIENQFISQLNAKQLQNSYDKKQNDTQFQHFITNYKLKCENQIKALISQLQVEYEKAVKTKQNQSNHYFNKRQNLLEIYQKKYDLEIKKQLDKQQSQLKIYEQNELQDLNLILDQQLNSNLETYKTKKQQQQMNHKNNCHKHFSMIKQQLILTLQSQYESELKNLELEMTRQMSYNSNSLISLKIDKLSQRLNNLRLMNNSLRIQIQQRQTDLDIQNKQKKSLNVSYQTPNKNDIEKLFSEINNIKQLVYQVSNNHKSQKSIINYDNIDDMKVVENESRQNLLNHQYDQKQIWEQRIQNERRQIESLKNKLLNDKIKVKSTQNKLQGDLTTYQQKVDSNHSSDNPQSKELLNQIRTNLNELIRITNQDIVKMKENEKIIKNKEFKLEQIEFNLRYQFNHQLIQQQYDEYIQIQIKYSPPQKYVPSSIFQSKSQNQLQNSIELENYNDSQQMTIKDLDDNNKKDQYLMQSRHIKSQSYNNLNQDQYQNNQSYYQEQQLKELQYGNLIENTSLNIGLPYSHQYQYDKQMANFQEQRNKTNQILLGHSFWLKNLKYQLNKNIHNLKTTKKPLTTYSKINRSFY